VVQGIDLMTAHKFSNMVFAGVELWTVEEKRDLVAMMKVIKPNGAATNAEAGLPVAEATVATVESGAGGTEVFADKSDASLKAGTSIVGQAVPIATVAGSPSTSAVESAVETRPAEIATEPPVPVSATAEAAKQPNVIDTAM
jgi:hypothetical protein